MAQRATKDHDPGRPDLLTQSVSKSSPQERTLKIFTKKAENANLLRQRRGFKKPAASPRLMADAELPELFGNVTFKNGWTSNEDAVFGFYDITTPDPALQVQGPKCLGGGVVIDNVFYGVDYMAFFNTYFAYIRYYDMTSGSLLYEKTGKIHDIAPAGYQINPVTGEIWGIAFNDNADGYELVKVEFTDMGINRTKISDLPGDWAAFAIDGQGQMYGIDRDMTIDHQLPVVTETRLNRISEQGAVSLVGVTGELAAYVTGATIDPKTNRMFWVVNPADETAWLCEVNLSTGKATRLFEYVDGDQIVDLYIPERPDESAPDICTGAVVNFDGTSLSGTVSVTAPANFYGGLPGTGNITIHVLANGIEAGSTETRFGAEVEIPVSVPSSGNYDFQVYASNGNGNGPKLKIGTQWVGPDTPAATTATLTYADGNMKVDWLPVTETVNGGNMDLDNLTYTVVRADGSVAASGLKATSFTESIEVPQFLTAYYYTVYAVCGDLKSEGAVTNTVSLGTIVPPYAFDFATDKLNGWTILDSNGDGASWSLDGNAARCMFSNDVDLDDWLITPPVYLEAGKAYPVDFDTWNNFANFSERLEVKFGKDDTAAGMSGTLLEPTVVTGGNANGQHIAKYLVPETTGTYYIGFHAISDIGNFFLYVSNVSIGASITAMTPETVSNLTLTADPDGAYKVQVAFDLPSSSLSGLPLSSISKVEIKRGDEVVKVYENRTPGQHIVFEDTTIPASGDYLYHVTVYVGDLASQEVSGFLFVGFKYPEAPESVNLKAGETAGYAVVTWSPVMTDITGKTYPAGSLVYNVYQMEGNGGRLISKITDGSTSYTYEAVAAGKQDFVQVAVMAEFEGTEGNGSVSPLIPIGTPYPGIHETGNFGKYGWSYSNEGGGSWGLYRDDSLGGVTSQDGDDFYFGCIGSNEDAYGYLYTGLITLEDMTNPGLTFYNFNIQDEKGNPDVNEIVVSVRIEGEEEYTELFRNTPQEICDHYPNVWKRATVGLQQFAGKTVQIRFAAVVKQYFYTLIDNIYVGPILGEDLRAANISAPATVKTGTDFNVDVRVANYGANEASGWSVGLYADGVLVAEKAGQPVESGLASVVTFNCEMPALAQEPVNYYAVVTYGPDEDQTNNTSETVVVTPVVSKLPAPEDLTGVLSEDGVLLEWSEPDTTSPIAGDPVVEDFEDAAAFSDQYGNWIFVDKDESPVGGMNELNMPGITPGQTTGSFWIWDHSLAGNDTFKAHSGNKYLFALFRWDDGETDDWAISPELYGVEQQISLWAKSYEGMYPEKIEIWYSTGSTDPDDFIKIEGAGAEVVPDEWTLFSATVPEGAKRFAIRSCARGSFMLMVDDVSFIPVESVGELSILGYNVYRNGEKINDNIVEECEYTDTTAVDGVAYEYQVTALYVQQGESIGSNVVSLTPGGMEGLNGSPTVTLEGRTIVIRNASGLKITVTSSDGIILFDGIGNSEQRIEADKGIYLIKIGTRGRKIAI